MLCEFKSMQKHRLHIVKAAYCKVPKTRIIDNGHHRATSFFYEKSNGIEAYGKMTMQLF